MFYVYRFFFVIVPLLKKITRIEAMANLEGGRLGIP